MLLKAILVVYIYEKGTLLESLWNASRFCAAAAAAAGGGGRWAVHSLSAAACQCPVARVC